MNRIDEKFQALKTQKKKAFIAFVTAGDPNLKTTEELVLAFEQSGVDIVELGVPFSDPLADGSTIQASSQRALKKGVNLEKIFHVVGRIRKKSQIPIALMTYYNPVFHYGETKFIKAAYDNGVDGVIVPDLPPEEADSLMAAARKRDIATTFFLSPTTTPKRMKHVIAVTTGFVYYVSLTGVTGARKQAPISSTQHIKSVVRVSSKPVCIGFGISNAAQVKSMSKISDGVIVGSAIVNEILKNKGNKNLIKNVAAFVKTLSKGL